MDYEQYRGPDGFYNGPLEKVESTDPFVLLEGLEHGNRFWSVNTGHYESGWYRLLGTAKTPEEAIQNLYRL